MGFLSWFENNPQEEESAGEQLSLLDNSEALTERRRVDGATVRKRYVKTIQDKGGSGQTYARATEALTQSVMGVGTRELYRQTGAKLKQRDTLPVVAQEALMSAEVLANHDLKQKEVEGDEDERDRQIVESAQKSGQNWRKLLPW